METIDRHDQHGPSYPIDPPRIARAQENISGAHLGMERLPQARLYSRPQVIHPMRDHRRNDAP